MSKKVLGRGLDALIPSAIRNDVTTDGVSRILVNSIRANARQPRKKFDEEKLQALAESIRQDGVLQPIVVQKRSDGYELIMGERRLQASRIAGIQTIPAVIKRVEEVDGLRLALVENLQRENLTAIEIAEGYRLLVDTFGLSRNELADLVAKDRSSVANTLRLLGLPEEIRNMINDGQLTEGHARSLLRLTTRAEQLALAERIVKHSLSVRQVEMETGAPTRSKPSKRRAEKSPQVKLLENAMSQHLATKVAIDEKRGGKGKIVIEFYSHEDFERIAESMNVPLPR